MQPRAPWSNCLSASPLSESSDDLTPSDSMAKSSQVSLVSLVMVMMVGGHGDGDNKLEFSS